MFTGLNDRHRENMQNETMVVSLCDPDAVGVYRWRSFSRSSGSKKRMKTSPAALDIFFKPVISSLVALCLLAILFDANEARQRGLKLIELRR